MSAQVIKTARTVAVTVIVVTIVIIDASAGMNYNINECWSRIHVSAMIVPTVRMKNIRLCIVKHFT